VGLYVGGQEISQDVKDSIKTVINQNKTHVQLLEWIELNGARFSVYDQQNYFGAIAFDGKNTNYKRITKK
jgi:hypothetical protein